MASLNDNGVLVDVTGRLVTNLTLEQVSLNSNGDGFYVAATVQVHGMTVTGSHFDGNLYGFAATANAGSNHNQDGFTGLSVDSSTFSNNQIKGIYVEKLADATLGGAAGITVDSDGTAYGYRGGIDINLKYGTYGRRTPTITIQHATLTNNGTSATAPGFGLAIKGRNDGAYAANPANLSGVTLTDVTAGQPDRSVDRQQRERSKFFPGSAAGRRPGPDALYRPLGVPARRFRRYALRRVVGHVRRQFLGQCGRRHRGNLEQETNNFRIEDKLYHQMNNSSLGLITWVTDNVYVTAPGTFAQVPPTRTPVSRAASMSPAMATRSTSRRGRTPSRCSLRSPSTCSARGAGWMPHTGRAGTSESILTWAGGPVQISANHVTVDGFTIEGTDSSDKIAGIWTNPDFAGNGAEGSYQLSTTSSKTT